ncbi:molybdate ABC transporter substrate-binding protein [Clostridium boliviensis]|uniref:Molybdate ABC transporter substrate-binding protein n=1 Tax=Clostridium boliviensis TaxID=318465 RepID=A0ABU4GL14_9CLOT|nr:molybdate ABC transporter substrate-binding protein [Clostridium boliviensis]MDW2798301.1 molybdate ABC transporter substrate-binding protein [Clostridium boliviensis]
MKRTCMVTMCAVIISLSVSGCAKNVSNPASESAKQTDTKAEPTDLSGHTLSVYCGAGMTKPFQKIADEFKTRTGCDLEITFANAGQIQTQINTAKEGDLFVAGSADELKPVSDVVTASKDLVKHIPVLAVKSGNPLKITRLSDLSEKNVRLVLGDTKSTPIGKISDKALTDAGVLDQVNVIARTTTAPEIFNALKVDECDAIIVWKENVTDSSVEIVDTDEMQKYIKTIPAASLSYCDDTQALTAFLNYLDSDNAHTIWENFGYEVIKNK